MLRNNTSVLDLMDLHLHVESCFKLQNQSQIQTLKRIA